MPKAAPTTKSAIARRANKQSKAAEKAALLAGSATVETTPVIVAAKPAKPDYAVQREQRIALISEARNAVAAFYNGASLTVHKSKAPKLSDCIARIEMPVQRAANGASERDESLLIRLVSVCDSDGRTFDPSQPNIAADLGVLSRLASLGYIGVAASTGLPFVTDTGAERAGAVIARAKRTVAAMPATT